MKLGAAVAYTRHYHIIIFVFWNVLALGCCHGIYCRHAHLLCFSSYQLVAEAVDMVELSVPEAESPTDSEPLTEIVLHGK